MELVNIFEVTNRYHPVANHHKKIKWRTIAAKNEIIPIMKEDNYL
jgi:hypothetical protein